MLGEEAGLGQAKSVEKGKFTRQDVIDAFTDQIFGGNPAAVCVLDHWPDEKLMQNITKENNLSETAFAVAFWQLGIPLVCQQGHGDSL